MISNYRTNNSILSTVLCYTFGTILLFNNLLSKALVLVLVDIPEFTIGVRANNKTRVPFENLLPTNSCGQRMCNFRISHNLSLTERHIHFTDAWGTHFCASCVVSNPNLVTGSWNGYVDKISNLYSCSSWSSQKSPTSHVKSKKSTALSYSTPFK